MKEQKNAAETKNVLCWMQMKKGEQKGPVRPVNHVVLVAVQGEIVSEVFSEEKRNSRDLRMSRT